MNKAKWIVISLASLMCAETTFAEPVAAVAKNITAPPVVRVFRCRKALESEIKLRDTSPVVANTIRLLVAQNNLPPQVADIRLAVLGLQYRLAIITISKGYYLRYFHEMDDWLRNFDRLDSGNHLLPTLTELNRRLIETMAANAEVDRVAESADAEVRDNLGVTKLERALLAREKQVAGTLGWLRVQGKKDIENFILEVQKNEVALSRKIDAFQH